MKPLLKKIDIHVHAVPRAGLPRPGSPYTFCTPQQLRAMYDLIGVEKGTLLPCVSPDGSHVVVSNEENCQMVTDHPETFFWFCNIDPRMGNNAPDTNFSYFLDYYKSLGARGVGEITANLYFDDPRVWSLFDHCQRCQMPVTFHIGNMGGDYGLVDEIGLPRLEKTLQAFPNLQFLGHSQKFWSEISGDVTPVTRGQNAPGPVTPGGRVVELMRRYPNLCGDLSAGSGSNAVMRDPDFGCAFIEEFADRLYFGTDICSPENITWPMLKLSGWLDEMMTAGNISYEAYEKVSRKNAEKLLGVRQ